MKFMSFLLCLASQPLAYAQVQVNTDVRLASVMRLGELNGIALQCDAREETRRMKQALVEHLPKRKQLGDLFDYETNRSFMHFMQAKATCPAAQELNQLIDRAIRQLGEAYSESPAD